MLWALLRPAASVPDGNPAWGGREEMQVFPVDTWWGEAEHCPTKGCDKGRATCGRLERDRSGKGTHRGRQRTTVRPRFRDRDRERNGCRGYREQGQGGSSDAEANAFGERGEGTSRRNRAWQGGSCGQRTVPCPSTSARPTATRCPSLTGGSFADVGLSSGCVCEGSWRPAYPRSDPAVCASPRDGSVWVRGGGVASGLGFLGLRSAPCCCAPRARPKRHPTRAQSFARTYGAEGDRRHSLVKMLTLLGQGGRTR